MKSTLNADKVTFSAGARARIGAHGTPIASLPYVGLLGEDITFQATQEMRQKTDQFPRVTVAQAVLSQAAQLNMILREFTVPNLLLGLGLEEDDVTEEAGGDTAVTDEAVTFNSDGVAALRYPLKAGSSITSVQDAAGGAGTPSVEDTDYVVIERDLQGRTLLKAIGGNIAAGDTVYVDYTYALPQRTILPIGRRATVAYKSIFLEEELTNGGKHELWIPRAQVGFAGNFNLNAAENSGEVPIVAQALYDATEDALALHYYYDEA